MPEKIDAAWVGVAIRDLRDERGWSQEELARRVGGSIRQSDISRIEAGARAPRRRTIEKIVSPFQLTVEDVLRIAKERKTEFENHATTRPSWNELLADNQRLWDDDIRESAKALARLIRLMMERGMVKSVQEALGQAIQEMETSAPLPEYPDVTWKRGAVAAKFLGPIIETLIEEGEDR